MHTFNNINPPNPHKCQIDCTNHDEVINKLQVKSKDLYYFWRNYEWLYNKYYNEPRKTNTKQQDQKIRAGNLPIDQDESMINSYQQKYRELEREYQSLQNQNHILETQKKNLQNLCRTIETQSRNLSQQIESLSKDLHKKQQISSSIQQDYKKEIKRLKEKIQNYQDIQANLQHDLRQSKLQNSRLQAQLQNLNESFSNQTKKYQASVRNLEESLDKLRMEITNQPNPSQLQSRSAMIGQDEEISLSYTKIKHEAENIINMEMQKTRSELKQQFSKFIFSLTQGQMESLLVNQLLDFRR